jgi:hypothetical protein
MFLINLKRNNFIEILTFSFIYHVEIYRVEMIDEYYGLVIIER